MTNRRQLIKALGATPLMAAVLPGIASAKTTLSSTTIAPNMTLISGAGANVVVAEGANSVIVVNGGLEANSEALLAEINRISGNKPVAAVFNTNWRPEFSGLNHLLSPKGVPVIAHENTRLWQGAQFFIDWQNEQHEPVAKAAQANQTFYKSGSMMLDAETVEYGYVSQANTDGDIYVHFKNADVLVLGSILGTDSYLLLDYVTGGWISGAQKTTAAMLERASDKTVIIAAQGGVQGKAQLEEQAAMLAHAYDEVARAFQSGHSLAEFKASNPMQDYRQRWGDPELFLTLLYNGTWYHVPGRAVKNIV